MNRATRLVITIMDRVAYRLLKNEKPSALADGQRKQSSSI
jgi:hypothetical protein